MSNDKPGEAERDEFAAKLEASEAGAAALREALEKFFATRQSGKYRANGDFCCDGDAYLVAYELAETTLNNPFAGAELLERLRNAEGDSLTLNSFCKAHGTPMMVLSGRNIAIAERDALEAECDTLRAEVVDLRENNKYSHEANDRLGVELDRLRAQLETAKGLSEALLERLKHALCAGIDKDGGWPERNALQAFLDSLKGGA